MVAPGVRREAVVQACATHGVSQRRACQALSVDWSSLRYLSVRPDDADARAAMKAVAGERRRFGYRCVHVMLERQGNMMNLKKAATALLRRTPSGASQGWPKVCLGNAAADAGAGCAERALVPRFRQRCVDGWTSVPRSGGGR